MPIIISWRMNAINWPAMNGEARSSMLPSQTASQASSESVFGLTELLRVVHNLVHEKRQSEHRSGQGCKVVQGQHIHRKKDGDVNGQPRPHRGAASAALGLVHLGFLPCGLHGTHEGEFGATLGQTEVCEGRGAAIIAFDSAEACGAIGILVSKKASKRTADTIHCARYF